ncbi:hypothetical protein [Bacillus sp. NPDC093026]|uniref:hypothetical protein n=1 Tax=Bacillus sp. NPDC093026 TaxID=3363948 RepID=UPI0038090716
MKALREIENRKITKITKIEYENDKWIKKFAKHRNTGVNEFWYQERQRILNKENPTTL